ncbi:hypothetical protein BGZ61DRAFT_515638 [Ilyonectria robusta]|uniref:uncharacterized protein n=1 Tax=Ilyonectria robusta TaxID=1079257 RepID=UPI001E8E1162|nr:uncharacterized protein BGZ61DRAFT_515638 [Ilyonectria robusta]KAH8729611.1 hypothetical protein BGZ61DRAFT_515638 [Ilyonectria robusta]
MAGAEQNGIDILCDAAGSDMLLSSLFSLASPAQDSNQRGHQAQQSQHQQQHSHQQQEHHQHHPPPPGPQEDTPRSGHSSLPAKRKLSDASLSSPSHVCHICRRVYERADHLTRHLRSHENARPYQCSRCPKRFNRADLLTRHETTHDRDGIAKDRPFIRRSDRAAEACLNCAASKAKCEDQKPCSRCRSKSLPCQMPSRRGNQYRTDSQAGMSPSEASTMASAMGMDNQGFASGDSGYLSKPSTLTQGPLNDGSAEYEGSAFLGTSSMDGLTDDLMYFNPVHNLFQDMDFSWDLDFDGFTIPRLDVNGPSPQSTSTINSKRSSRHVGRDVSRGHAAFKRSPWIFEPDMKDYVHRETEALTLDDEALPASSAFEKFASSSKTRLQMPSHMRDRLFAMVLAHNPNPQRVPSFPSLELLNYLLQAHFAQEERKCDALIHKASFDPATTIPELLSAIISSGATYISVPAIWQFGLALDEVARLAIAGRFEGSNSTTRDLMTHQAMMLHLDVGQWSGFNRKMEIAESFVQPLLTMLRRSGRTSFSSDSVSQMPSISDSPEVLDSKWRQFVVLESYKRLVIHMFFHDIQSSIGLCKNPLMSYNELCFTLPASRDLWRARTAEEWRDVSLTKKPMPNGGIPRVAEVTQCMTILDDLEDRIDIELSSTALLHGFWGQIWSYRDAVKFHSSGGPNRRGGSSPPLWLKTQHQELYRDIAEFSNQIQHLRKPKPQLILLAELFMMILHVSPNDLQQFAGKNGEEEARRAAQTLEENWFSESESRYAAWHAGQVFHWARKLAPTSLRGFNAIAVYFASLTLWAYGLATCARSTNGQKDGRGSTIEYVLMDGDETRESRAFLQLDRGVPGITSNGDPSSGAESLSNTGMILTIARNTLRDNFPVRKEPLPPLVESLGQLLRDLGSGLAGRASRAISENPPPISGRSP